MAQSGSQLKLGYRRLRYMDSKDIKALKNDGWVVECESPLEIRHPETDSFASFYAAQLVLEMVKLNQLAVKLKLKPQ